MKKTDNRQAGFGPVIVLVVVLVVVVIGAAGWVVYQHHKGSGTPKANTTTSQTTSQQQSTTTTQTQPVAYLDIKEWGIKLPLSNTISDAYYVAGVGSVGSDGVSNQIFLGLTSLDTSGCTAAGSNHGQDSALGMIFRTKPTDVDPVTNKAYSQEYPNGATVGTYYYAFQGSANSNISTCKAPQSTVQSVDSAFATAAKGMVSATATTN